MPNKDVPSVIRETLQHITVLNQEDSNVAKKSDFCDTETKSVSPQSHHPCPSLLDKCPGTLKCIYYHKDWCRRYDHCNDVKCRYRHRGDYECTNGCDAQQRSDCWFRHEGQCMYGLRCKYFLKGKKCRNGDHPGDPQTPFK